MDKYIRSTVDRGEVAIRGRDHWIKVVGMLQQNWALIECVGAGCTVYFVDDTSGVFDRMSFASVAEAERGLLRNGFTRYNLFCAQMSAERSERHATELAAWNSLSPSEQRYRGKPEEPILPHRMFAPPLPPFRPSEHPNGPIYSSGRHWQ